MESLQQFKERIWPVIAGIGDNIKVEPDQSVSFQGSTNDVDDFQGLKQELFEELFLNGMGEV